MSSITSSFRSKGKMITIGSQKTQKQEKDETVPSRRYSDVSRRKSTSVPELKVHMSVPSERKTFDDGVYFQSPGNRLMRRRSTNLTSLVTGKVDTLKPMLARFHSTGSKLTTNGSDTGRRLTFSDLLQAQAATRRVSERRRSKVLHHRKEVNKRALIKKFRMAANMAAFCVYQCNTHCLRNNDDDELSPFLKTLHFREYPTMAGIDLMFDKSKFKASKQTKISDETRRILCKPPKERTEQELYIAQIAMRNIKCFQEYPARMQRLIAEVGVYESFEARRVLVRQGHPASSFYFILSGTVVVMIMEPERQYARPVAYLYRGQSFGELAIINRTTRQSTVIAKELSEFLTISVDDYHRIFMAGGAKCLTDPDHDQFLRNLSFMEGWPVRKLEAEPSKCLFLYFKRGDVLIRDSNYSDWLIVVKSGSLSVLKKLKKVEAFEWRLKGSEVTTEKEKRENEKRRQQWRLTTLPELSVELRDPDDEACDEGEQSGIFQHPEIFQPEIYRQKSDYFSTTVWQFGQSDGHVRNFQILSNISDSISGTRNRSKSVDGDPPSKSSSRSLRKRRRRIRPRSLTNDQNSPQLNGVRRESVLEQEREMMGFTQHIRTIREDLDAAIKRRDSDDVTPADLNPEFVKIQTITKGQVFGLTDLFLGKQTSLCVVSNGADCLLVNKHFYMDHVTDELFRKMRQELCPYPSEEVLQTNLQTSVDWSAYREATLSVTVRLVQQRRSGS